MFGLWYQVAAAKENPEQDWAKKLLVMKEPLTYERKEAQQTSIMAFTGGGAWWLFQA